MPISRIINRRAVLVAAFALPFELPGAAQAALKMPTRAAPPRLKPLGQWKIVDRRPEGEPGSVVTVELSFRPVIDVADPQINWWPRSVPQLSFPIPATATPTIAGVPTVAPVGPTPIPIGHSRRPAETPLGEELVGQIFTPVFLPVTIDRAACRTAYLIYCQMRDPVTNRSSLYGFRVYVSSGNCPRPTGIPRKTPTPRS
ncbi:MAG: hypothetical protein EPO26_01375 [Chloroflexota bacterium]|nr:MAG: hypothetical protein EPO26_01375 [Chloroflexota bacterium]